MKSTSPKKEVRFQIPTDLSAEEVRRLNESKKAENSDIMATKPTTDTTDSVISPTKTEGRFHLPSLPSFDDTLQTIKETLRLDEAKRGQNTKLENSDLKGNKLESTEPSTNSSTSKKESTFHVPNMPLFDKTFQTIRGTLWVNEITQEQKAKAENPDGSATTSTTNPSDSSGTTTKKERRFQLPTFPFSDSTMESIKETSRFHESKRDENIAHMASESLGTKSDKAQSITETPVAKKEGGFHLPPIQLLENAFMSIKGTLRREEKKSEFDEKRDRSPSTGVNQVEVQPEKANPVYKK